MEDLLGKELLKICGGRISTSRILKRGKYYGLYFASGWCPACRAFTPQLINFYNRMPHNDVLEIVYLSSDNDENQFLDNFHIMPWLALPYYERDRRNQLASKFNVTGIPTLVILNENGEVVIQNARANVAQDPIGQNFPWL